MYDLYELMAFLCEIDEMDLCESEIADIFYEKYDIDEDHFQDLVADLIPLYTMAKSELTDTWYQGFGSEGSWLIKQEIMQ
jgi:hypothetical protein